MKSDRSIRTNETALVKFAVQGTVMYPRSYGWEISRTGQGVMLPSVGGITYNVKVGDSVFGLAGDHIEPGVSLTSDPTKLAQDPNRGFNVFSCVGNDAVILSGDAKGEKGTVTGHHGGVEHVLADFSDATLEKLTQDDKVLIRAFGQGLRLLDYPDVYCFSLDPALFWSMGVRPAGEGRLEVPVAAIVPGKLMGSGLGHSDIFKGDYDIQTSDPAAIREHQLDRLRFGDLVAIVDHDSSFGWNYQEGAVSIGVVVHGDSQLAGHGPGVQTLLTSRKGLLRPALRADANIGLYLGLGRWRKSSARKRKG
ncbi:MAG: DUF4438 domain-containing protein [Candidatus Manganitrophaceae bacterium]|nr:MAG: DUF4438 domain-containing protein [Candidatus Manganitrophaceae bacterium]